MVNPERGSFLSKITKRIFGKPHRVGGDPAMPEAVAPIRLTDQGKTLAAMLSAYDAQQAGMTLEQREAQNRKVASGEEDVIVSDAEFQRRRAGVQIRQDSGKSMEEAMRNVEALEAASEQIPGIKGLIRMLAEQKGEEKK